MPKDGWLGLTTTMMTMMTTETSCPQQQRTWLNRLCEQDQLTTTPASATGPAIPISSAPERHITAITTIAESVRQRRFRVTLLLGRRRS
jgi:hypothetical protein